MNTRRGIYFGYIFLLVFVLLTAVSCAKRSPGKETAFTINDYVLTVEEFNELFAELELPEDTPQARRDFLENLIKQKLLLQEAQRQGLDKQSDFLKSIERFWQQSLLKLIIDKKAKETAGRAAVTEQEVRDYYERWSRENPESAKTYEELSGVIRQQLLNMKQLLIINSWIDDMKKSAKIKVDKKVLGIEP